MTNKTKARNGTSPRLEGLNYHRIARESGYVPQHVSRVLRGMKGCTLEAAGRMADAAGVTLDALRAHIDTNRASIERKNKKTAKAA